MTERSPILDASEIFRILAEHGVDYVLIGGIAVQTHGHVLPSRTPGEWVVRLGLSYRFHVPITSTQVGGE